MVRQAWIGEAAMSDGRPDMTSDKAKPTCRLVRAGAEVVGKQGHLLAPGISAQSAGAQRIHLQIVRIPPGVRSKAHKHENHESAIYILSGESGCWYGDELQHHLVARAGDFLYIPANMPHLPYNLSDTESCVAVVARTDPNEQESVRLLPELEDLTPIDKPDLRRL
jgi:uncharacterized RmlC-like cupin family protein